MDKSPKISIVTVCFNSGKTIEATIKSVVVQKYQNIEYIVIDGLSTDNTLDIVRNYSDFITKVVSEKDNGVYDAMDRGIQLATGNVIGFLNSDDLFVDEQVVELTRFAGT